MSTRNRLSERLKGLQLSRPSWWFAYTNATRQYLVERGVAASRVTVVQNAVDTDQLRNALADVTASAPVPQALYVGSLYQEKQIDYLVQVGREMAATSGDFKLTIAGDGPQRSYVETLAEELSWLSYYGRVDSPAEKVALAREASLFLNPGLIGLAVVEAFALGLPVVTKYGPNHSPEFEYLEDGYNSILLADGSSPKEMASQCLRALADPTLIARLRLGAKSSGEAITLDAMVENFAQGVESWLL
ncbi:glycosyltransferase family 4 protein [Actinomycetospora sp. CA-101289]|uniref:glycosyltransferase family 4 protein n=1 Tax=Actinomycetospora sp. CA-101289 TaxID=3239893 RepID=UPI003D9910CD